MNDQKPLSQQDIMNLLIEGSGEVTPQRWARIHVTLYRNMPEFELDKTSHGLHIVVDKLLTDTKINRPDLLPTLFPLFAMLCGKSEKGLFLADIDWSIMDAPKRYKLSDLAQDELPEGLTPLRNMYIYGRYGEIEVNGECVVVEHSLNPVVQIARLRTVPSGFVQFGALSDLRMKQANYLGIRAPDTSQPIREVALFDWLMETPA